MLRLIKKYKWYCLGIGIALMVWYYFCLPKVLFNDPISVAIMDKDNNLLGARIATDEQWRFPINQYIPEDFKKAIICFEDKRFYEHIGVDFLAFFRAVKLNIANQKIVSGGSTISMQVIRLSRKGQQRSFLEKLIEFFLATRLELKYSKEEILALYASNAPFGGNIVGLDAASWKYFGRKSDQLSLAETTVLAVLPNAPSLIHMGRNRDRLLEKRNWLLDKMLKTNLIDSLSCKLAKEEPLPNKVLPLPSHAPRLLSRIIKEQGDKAKKSIIKTTIDGNLQQQINGIVHRHHQQLKQTGINNIAALVVDIKTGNVISYVGNTPYQRGKHGYDVDIIKAPRSSGSIFKPFLYAATLDGGEIMPHSLLTDIPSYYSGYTPENFDRKYSGAVAASEALSRSLNVPTIRLLSDFGIHKFHAILTQLGLKTINKPAHHYGLSMVVGGAECSLWDIAGAYAGMARSLNQFSETNGKYKLNNYRPLHLILPDKNEHKTLSDQFVKHDIFSAGAIWHTFEALTQLKRPGSESYWRSFSSSRKIAWKTGTSFGFRDAWAVGCTPKYAVAVWCGNADGEGRPDLVGVKAAGPVMLDIFNSLEYSAQWFTTPYDDLVPIAVCSKSGFKAKDICETTDTIFAPLASNKTIACPFHKILHLDKFSKYQVNSSCYSPSNMIHQSYFILPPTIETYYKQRNPDYKIVPPYRTDCLEASSKKVKSMQLVYPNTASKISIPVNLDETKSSTVFEVSHRTPKTTIYWHLDQTYIGKTKNFHEFAFNPKVGSHLLTLVDENGEVLEQKFEIF